VPAARRLSVRILNPIERCFREVHRRSNRGRMFVDAGGLERMIFGLLSRLNRRCARQSTRIFRRKEQTHVA